ncbi:MAG: hypothetical protein WC375_02435 [Methanomassiliicoccales archaeon]|jgi:hypothetical protein
MTVAAIFLSLAAFFNDFRWRSARGGKAALALSALLALTAPLTFMVYWTTELESGTVGGYELEFSGERNVVGFLIEYGPGLAWYLPFFSFAFLSFALIISMRTKRTGMH